MAVIHDDTLEIPRKKERLDATLRLPGSKSISNRALVIAALAEGDSQLSGILDCDDTRVMARALCAMGATVDTAAEAWRVHGVAGRLRNPPRIDVQASGTAARFLTAVAACADGATVLDGTERMRQRPIGELVDALGSLGVDVEASGEARCPPVRVSGSEAFGGEATVDASRSSQFVSALLLAAPLAQRGVTLVLRDGKLVSRPYVDVTIGVMLDFGVEVLRDDPRLRVAPGQRYRGRSYGIEPDASTAAYFLGAAAVTGGRVRLQGLSADSAQADMGFLGVLQQMGCRVQSSPGLVELQGPEALKAVDVDMNAMPDAVLAASVVALFADGTTHIRNVAHMRLKETDRLAALENELRKLGADARADVDSLHITPGELRGARIDTYDDHRMAMAFSLAGLAVDGVCINDPSCVSKSWPGYFDAFLAL